MYKNLSVVYDKLMDVDYNTYKNIISQELEGKKDLLILDLGCGSGSLTKHLANFGKVIGIDKSEEMLAVASNKFPTASYFAMDLLEVDSLNMQFDFILSAFDVLNYLENFADFSSALEKIYNSMAVGSKFIFDMHTPEKINFMLHNQPFAYEDEEISYLWFTYETEQELEVESELTFFVREKEDLYKKLYEYQKQRTYEIELVTSKLEEIGFTIKNYFCDFDYANKDYENSQRIIFVVEKY